jgi:hypothetical protein
LTRRRSPSLGGETETTVVSGSYGSDRLFTRPADQPRHAARHLRSNETVTPTSLARLVPRPSRRGTGSDRPRARAGFPRPERPSRGSASVGRIRPALAPPPRGLSSRRGPIDGTSAPASPPRSGNRALSRSVRRKRTTREDDLPPTEADLALEEIYLPFSAAIPNNATLRTRIVRG